MSFEAPPYRLVLDDGFAPLELGEALHQLCVDDLDTQLLASGRLPALDGAPVASWLLARLEGLSAGLGLSSDRVEEIEDAVWVVDFVLQREGQPVGKLQLQGGMIGAGLLGVLAGAEEPSAVSQAVLQALLAAPDEVCPCEVRVCDPEPEGQGGDDRPEAPVLRFGLTAEGYLGADNPGPES